MTVKLVSGFRVGLLELKHKLRVGCLARV